MKIHSLKLLPFLLIPVFLWSCTEFFSTSWAPWAARGSSGLIPNVTSGNVEELIEMTADDPDLSMDLLRKIKEAAEGASGQEKADLQAAAVEAAVNAIGLGQTILNAVTDLGDIINDPDKAIDAAKKAIDNMPNLDEASTALLDTLPPVGSTEFDDFVNTASAEELAMAAIILFAEDAKSSGKDIDDYITDFGIAPPGTPEVGLALALVTAIGTKPTEDLPDSLKSILEGLNLK